MQTTEALTACSIVQHFLNKCVTSVQGNAKAIA